MKQNKSFKIISLYFILPFFFSSGDAIAYKESDLQKLLKTKKCVKCDLSKADLSFANLSEANLNYADLRRANLKYAVLPRANLASANLYGTNLQKAVLALANLSEADLRDADLRDANLYGANLSGANLSGANLSGANLTKANLKNADLTGIDLDSANIRDADLTGVISPELDFKRKKEEELLRKQEEKKQALRKKEQEVLRKEAEIRKKKEQALLNKKKEQTFKKFDNVLRKIGPTTEFLPIPGRGKLSCLIDHVTKTLRKRPLYSKSPSLRKCVRERVWKAERKLFERYEWYPLLYEFVYGEASEIDKTTRYDKLEKLCGNCEEYTQQMILETFCTSPGKGWCGDWGEYLRLLGVFNELDMHRQRCEGVKEGDYHNPCR